MGVVVGGVRVVSGAVMAKGVAVELKRRANSLALEESAKLLPLPAAELPDEDEVPVP